MPTAVFSARRDDVENIEELAPLKSTLSEKEIKAAAARRTEAFFRPILRDLFLNCRDLGIDDRTAYRVAKFFDSFCCCSKHLQQDMLPAIEAACVVKACELNCFSQGLSPEFERSIFDCFRIEFWGDVLEFCEAMERTNFVSLFGRTPFDSLFDLKGKGVISDSEFSCTERLVLSTVTSHYVLSEFHPDGLAAVALYYYRCSSGCEERWPESLVEATGLEEEDLGQYVTVIHTCLKRA